VRLFLAFLCLLAATACDEKSPVGPTAPLDQQFTLAPGEVATIQAAAIRLQFVGVTADSRCPADALCIWLGEAVVPVRVFDTGGSNEYELRTGDPQRASAMHRNVRIELLQLQPYPFSNRRIDRSEYRATLVVRR
jgi:hypothetical protein